ncbi:MAG: flagellar basal-body rod protein FlgF [Halobacteriovoraceae bacterium]|nr:flagellar basal-body rod protein FlgF [Halobacteriovoraceae bacterium]
MKNIWVPLSGQIAQQRKVETIANNIANANTNGFKKDQITFKEYMSAVDNPSADIDVPPGEFAPDDFYRSRGMENSYVKVDGSYTNFEQGALKPTRNKFDMALFGKGFFEVLTPNGIRFTRNGSFSLNAKGELVTAQGFKVLQKITDEQAKDPNFTNDVNERVINLTGAHKFSVSREGDVYANDSKLGSLSVVEFNDVHAIRKEGSTLYMNNDANNIKRDEVATTVNQGFVEGSNVNAVKEMSELINAHRHFDNIQTAIKTYDSISSKIVNDISKF